MTRDLERLRRFSLTVGIIVIVYALSGIRIDNEVQLLGAHVHILRPELLPIGLIAASLYAMCRFAYYGYVDRESPGRTRRRLIHTYRKGEGLVEDKDRDRLVDQFLNVTPERGVSLQFKRKANSDGAYTIEFSISPWTEHLWSRIIDIDYAAPVWVNAIALTVVVLSWCLARSS